MKRRPWYPTEYRNSRTRKSDLDLDLRKKRAHPVCARGSNLPSGPRKPRLQLTGQSQSIFEAGAKNSTTEHLETLLPTPLRSLLTPSSPCSRASLPMLFTGIRSILCQVEVISTFDLRTQVHPRCDLQGPQPTPTASKEGLHSMGPIPACHPSPHLPHPRPSLVEVDFGDQ